MNEPDSNPSSLEKLVSENTQALKSVRTCIIGLIIAGFMIALVSWLALYLKAGNAPSDEVIGKSINEWLEKDVNQGEVADAVQADFESLKKIHKATKEDFANLEIQFENLTNDFKKHRESTKKVTSLMQLNYLAEFLNAVRLDISGDAQSAFGSISKIQNKPSANELAPLDESRRGKKKIEDATRSLLNEVPCDEKLQGPLNSIRDALTDQDHLQPDTMESLQKKKQALGHLNRCLAYSYWQISMQSPEEGDKPKQEIYLQQIFHLMGLVEQSSIVLNYLVPEVEISSTALAKADEYWKALKDDGNVKPFQFETDSNNGGGGAGTARLWWLDKKNEKGFYVVFSDSYFIPIKILIPRTMLNGDNRFMDLWGSKHRFCLQDRSKKNGDLNNPIAGGVMQEFSRPENFYRIPGIFLTYRSKNSELKHYAIVGRPIKKQPEFNGENWREVTYQLSEIWECDERGKVDKYNHKCIYPTSENSN